jgi:2-oxoglutarate ferredoxin oxidoreductase subunit gamma
MTRRRPERAGTNPESTLERAVVFAGFGGQGLLFAGEVLARACLDQGLEVLWIPSYGPEMRGGTASCTVIVADGPIGSPVVDQVDGAIVLNPPSLARFEATLVPGGVLVVNESLIEADPKRSDVRIIRTPCTAEARSAGNERLTSVVGLGALVAALDMVSPDAVRTALRAMVERKHPELLQGNLLALEAGLRAGTSNENAARAEPDEGVVAPGRREVAIPA